VLTTSHLGGSHAAVKKPTPRPCDIFRAENVPAEQVMLQRETVAAQPAPSEDLAPERAAQARAAQTGATQR